MNIRKATKEDLDILIKLRFDYLISDRGNLSDNEATAILAQLQSYYLNHIGNDFFAILAEDDGKVVSTAFLVITEKPANTSFITGKTGTLLNVFTYKEFRRKGFALKVVQYIIEEARRLNLSLIELSATENGHPLYKKLGFAEKKTKYTSMTLQL